MLFQTALSDLGAESFSGGPVAHEDELEFDPLRDDCRRFDELKKALLSNQAAHVQHHRNPIFY